LALSGRRDAEPVQDFPYPEEEEYTSRACGACALKAQCTNTARRVIVRHFYEDEREAMHRRAVADPIWMKRRRETAEHPLEP